MQVPLSHADRWQAQASAAASSWTRQVARSLVEETGGCPGASTASLRYAEEQGGGAVQAETPQVNSECVLAKEKSRRGGVKVGTR